MKTKSRLVCELCACILFISVLLTSNAVYPQRKNIHKTEAQAGGKASGEATSEYDTYVLFDNPKVKKMIQVYNVKMRFIDDIMQASVTVVNTTKKPINVVYKFTWFDKDDFEVRANTAPWIPLTLQPNEQKTLQGVAPNGSAKSFKVKISLNK